MLTTPYRTHAHVINATNVITSKMLVGEESTEPSHTLCWDCVTSSTMVGMVGNRYVWEGWQTENQGRFRH